MAGSRTRIGYNALLGKIVSRLKDAAKSTRELGYESQNVSPREFYNYLTGETPTSDTTTIVDVLASDHLMIHEVVEICELKKMGVSIDKQTVMMFHPKVYEAHLTATEHELDYALQKKDYAWVKSRIKLAEFWLEDELMPEHLAPRCRAIVKKFLRALPKGI